MRTEQEVNEKLAYYQGVMSVLRGLDYDSSEELKRRYLTAKAIIELLEWELQNQEKPEGS